MKQKRRLEGYETRSELRNGENGKVERGWRRGEEVEEEDEEEEDEEEEDKEEKRKDDNKNETCSHVLLLVHMIDEECVREYSIEMVE